MKVVPPVDITDAKLLSSNIAEPDVGGGVWASGSFTAGESRHVVATKKIYIAKTTGALTVTPQSDPTNWVESRNLEVIWVSGTTYALGDLVIRTATHKVYERVIAGAGTTAPELDLVNWLEIGSTNRWSMFDTGRNTMSVSSQSIVVELQPSDAYGVGRADSIGVLGLQANHLKIEVLISAVVVQTFDYDLSSRPVASWTDYFFNSFAYSNSIVRFDLNNSISSVIRITITGTGSNPITCGSIVVGTSVYLGSVQRGVKSDTLNFSKIERDAFGTVTLIPRRSVPRVTQTLMLDKTLIKNAVDVRYKLNAIAALWSGLDEQISDDFFEPLLVMGIYKQFEIDIANSIMLNINLELEEL
jgi:hypothetical protein